MLKGLDHVAIAVTDLNKAVAQYEKFGFKVLERRELAGGGTMREVVMDIGQDRHLVIIEAKDPNNPVGRFLQRKGEGVYLVAFAVDSLTKTKEGLKAKGINPVEDTMEGRPQLFVHPRDAHGLLVQFVERP